jgi:hypothetical protein
MLMLLMEFAYVEEAFLLYTRGLLLSAPPTMDDCGWAIADVAVFNRPSSIDNRQ